MQRKYMDIVYIVGTASTNKNIELLYSIRSAYRMLSGIGKIYIIGHKPHFINSEAIHIQAYDKHPLNKERNIYEKILIACDHPDISNPFLCMHDDHFLLQSFKIEEFPYCYKPQDLHTSGYMKKPSDRFRISIFNTDGELKKRKLPTRYYDIHVPAIFDKQLFKETVGSFDWTYSCGYLIKSLYCNCLGVQGIEMLDCKIRKPLKEIDILQTLSGRIRFSTDDPAIDPAMENIFRQLYPVPSPVELTK